MPTCCERFAHLVSDPTLLAKVGRERPLDLEAAGRTLARDPVTVTARGVFLARDVGVQRSAEPIHVEGEGFVLPPWHHDTYAGGLGVDGATLARWRGGRVLDVGAGLGLFATEAATLGVEVDAVDAVFDDDHPSFAPAAAHVRAHYGEQLELLRCLATHARLPRYAMDDATAAALEALFADRDAIARRYPAASGRRWLDDARMLGRVDDARYDAAVSGWLLVHLDDDDARRAVASLVRAVRPGGEVRIEAGHGGDLAADLARAFPCDADGAPVIAGRRVAVESRRRGSLRLRLEA